MPEIKDIQKVLLNAIIDGEKNLAVETVVNWAKQNTFRKAFTDIFDQVLIEIGDLWYKNKLSLAQGYIAGKVAEEVFLHASNDDEFTKHTVKKGNVVVGNIIDDFHSLGRKLLSIFLKAAGYTVHDLGNDISAQEFVEKAIETNARIIGVSAMMYTTAKNIEQVRAELDKRNLSGKIQLAVGGAVFKLKPELVEEVGGDDTADNAINAPALFDELWKKSLTYE
ncbi:MAG: corrinoid-binding protein [Salinivirgaceae bacterium]|nr:MAG: corrinoid-binding protein [Salinivirgaceae bacterium]